MRDFDPNKPLIGPEDGLEYEDLGDYILGKPVECARNDVIARLREHPTVKNARHTWKDAVAAQYRWQNRNGDLYVHDLPINHPQGFDAFESGSPGSSARDGGAGAVQAPVDPVHAADQPAVPRWLGS